MSVEEMREYIEDYRFMHEMRVRDGINENVWKKGDKVGDMSSVKAKCGYIRHYERI